MKQCPLKGPFPAVLLITVAGSEGRDGKPKVIACLLCSQITCFAREVRYYAMRTVVLALRPAPGHEAGGKAVDEFSMERSVALNIEIAAIADSVKPATTNRVGTCMTLRSAPAKVVERGAIPNMINIIALVVRPSKAIGIRFCIHVVTEICTKPPPKPVNVQRLRIAILDVV